MKLELFQTTVQEYKRFAQQLPVDHSKAIENTHDEEIYVAEHIRLMLLRKYTRNGRGNLYIPDIVKEAKEKFPEDNEYLDEVLKRFQGSCEQSLKHFLSDGSERTLDESIDDIMYGLHLHADEARIQRIALDNENLRIYCVISFVKEVESILYELFSFLEEREISSIEKEPYLSAPTISFETGDITGSITGSPFWKNINGHDINEKVITKYFKKLLTSENIEDAKILLKVFEFTQLLSKENFLYDQMKTLVFNENINDWGDFSQAINYYERIPSPGISNVVRYNEQHNAAYVYILPNVKSSFTIESKHLIGDLCIITLIKDPKNDDWKVFAMGGKVDPFKR